MTDPDMMSVAEVLLGPSPQIQRYHDAEHRTGVQRCLFTEEQMTAMVEQMEVPPMVSPVPSTETPARTANTQTSAAKKRPASAAPGTESSSSKPKRPRKDINECIQGNVFVDKNGETFTKAQQVERIGEWLKTWDKKDKRSHVSVHLETMWYKHGQASFPISELRYMHGDKKRYISVRGMCNGHEVRGFPVFQPTKTTPKNIVKEVRFSDILCEQLVLRDRESFPRRGRYVSRVQSL